MVEASGKPGVSGKKTGLVSGGGYGRKDTCQPYSLPKCDHVVKGKYGPCLNVAPTPSCKYIFHCTCTHLSFIPTCSWLPSTPNDNKLKLDKYTAYIALRTDTAAVFSVGLLWFYSLTYINKELIQIGQKLGCTDSSPFIMSHRFV